MPRPGGHCSTHDRVLVLEDQESACAQGQGSVYNCGLSSVWNIMRLNKGKGKARSLTSHLSVCEQDQGSVCDGAHGPSSYQRQDQLPASGLCL